MHAGCREEIEVRFGKEEFEKLENVFLALGLNVAIKCSHNAKGGV